MIFIENFETRKLNKNGTTANFGSDYVYTDWQTKEKIEGVGNSAGKCKTGLKRQIVMLRQLLLEMEKEL